MLNEFANLINQLAAFRSVVEGVEVDDRAAKLVLVIVELLGGLDADDAVSEQRLFKDPREAIVALDCRNGHQTNLGTQTLRGA